VLPRVGQKNRGVHHGTAEFTVVAEFRVSKHSIQRFRIDFYEQQPGQPSHLKMVCVF
jgi:hypothetical protein